MYIVVTARPRLQGLGIAMRRCHYYCGVSRTFSPFFDLAVFLAKTLEGSVSRPSAPEMRLVLAAVTDARLNLVTTNRVMRREAGGVATG